MAAPVSFEFEKTVSSLHQTGKSELSAGKLQLSECLFERSTSSASNPTPYSTTEVRIRNVNIISFHGNKHYEGSRAEQNLRANDGITF